MNINDRYYKEFTIDGVDYKLTFIAGDTANVGTTEVELPDDVLINEINLKADYDKSIPLGLPLATTMSIKLNLNALEDNDINTWSDVRAWIVRGHSATQVVLSDTQFYVPNLWILERKVDSAYNIEYIGCQEKRPGIKIERTNSIDCEFTVECIDIVSFSLRNLTIDYLKTKFTLTEVAYDGVFLAIWNNYLCYRTPGYTYKLVSITELMGGIQLGLEEIMGYATRGIVNNVNYRGEIKTAFSLYKQQYDEYITVSSTQLTSDDIYLIAELVYSGTTIAGILHKSKSNNNLYNFANCYDLLKYWCEQWFVKVGYIYGTSIDIVFNKVKEHNVYTLYKSGKVTSGSNVVEVNTDGLRVGDYVYNQYFDYGTTITEVTDGTHIKLSSNATGGSPALQRLYFSSAITDLMIDKLTITTGEEAELIGGGICHLQDVIDEHTNKNDVTDTDLTEVEYRDASSALNDKTLEFELIFHNHICGVDGKYNKGTYIDWGLQRVIVRAMYYIDGTKLVKVHDYVTVNTGSETISPESNYNSESFNVTTINDLQGVVNRRNNKCGMGYVLAKTAYTLFGNEEQAIIETTTPSLMPGCLGQKYKIDTEALVNGNWLNLGSEAILTGIDTDLSGNKTNVKLFIYG